MVKRGMSAGTEQTRRVRELSQEQQDEQATKRELRRKVREFWSKQAHGYTPDDLNCVRAVNFGHCHLHDDDGVALASALTKEMTQLSELHLYGNRLHDSALCALASAFAAGTAPLVTHLHLGHNAIADKGLLALVEAIGGESKALPRLLELTLFNNKIGDAGVTALVQCAADTLIAYKEERRAQERAEVGEQLPPLPAVALKHLQVLGLSGNPIGNAGVAAFADAVREDDDVLAQLIELHLRETRATADGGLSALGDVLCKRAGLPMLRTLVIDEEALSHPRLKEAYAQRAGTGHGGVHAFKMVCFV